MEKTCHRNHIAQQERTKTDEEVLVRYDKAIWSERSDRLHENIMRRHSAQKE